MTSSTSTAMSRVQSAHRNFSSVNEFSNAISQLGWSTSFQQLDCGKGAAAFDAIVNSKAILHRVCCDRQAKQDVIPPQGYLTFGLPLSPLLNSTIENRPLRNDSLIYVHERDGFTCVSEPGFEAYSVALEASRMAEIATRLDLPNPGDILSIWGTEIRPDPKQLAVIKAIVKRIFQLERLITQDAEIMATLEELITLQLPSAILKVGSSHPAKNHIPVRNRERALRRALDYIEAHSKEALTVETLCVAAASSLSTLERAFRERFSISPKRYIIVQRLNHVHAALLHRRDSQSISAIAGEWGFTHMGQFAADYKHLFGVLPSHTPTNRR